MPKHRFWPNWRKRIFEDGPHLVSPHPGLLEKEFLKILWTGEQKRREALELFSFFVCENKEKEERKDPFSPSFSES
jgi:hypothetical protein